MVHSKCADSKLYDTMSKHIDKPIIAVIGVGNILLKDDGIGIHVIRELTGKIDSAKTEIIDGGTIPDIFTLIDKDIQKLIIIDAADAKGKPGTIYHIDKEHIESKSNLPVSLHEIGLSENLKILNLINPELKSVTIFGIQIADTGYGLEPSPEVSSKIPELIKLVLEEIEKTDKSLEVT